MKEANPQITTFDYPTFLKALSHLPGVYQMIDKSNTVIYVGKAKNLKKRVSSYFRENQASSKTTVMVKQIVNINITITHTEGEALLLENNLIKSLKPRYNILLRDDKSYPYIYLSNKDKFPRITKHRGARKLPGRYFGPYPSASSVVKSLNLLQKVFRVRQCEDSVFMNRSRACLQYQIKRCTAPCVNKISVQDYQKDIDNVVLFLEGKSAQLIDQLVVKMEQASEQLHYEDAVIYRDQIIHLRHIQEKQYISAGKGNIDVIAIASLGQHTCIQLFYIRDGLNLGNKSFFPKNSQDKTGSEVLNAFVMQYYLNSLNIDRQLPENILLNEDIEDKYLLEEVIENKNSQKISILTNVRGERAKWLSMAKNNAQIALESRLNNQSKILTQFKDLQRAIGLETLSERIECFDISHSSGEETVGSCVVFNQDGPLKSDYRRYNVKGITAGDDYAAMEQVLTRRYQSVGQRSESNKKSNPIPLPDILLIDGGKGQVTQAIKVLSQFEIDSVLIIGITKGEGRKAALDTLYIPEFSSQFLTDALPRKHGKVILKSNSQALHLIQQLRDEAHRFAITGHRLRRDKKRRRSELENIPGLGQKRRQLLLKQFGGVKEVKRAGVSDLLTVKGIGEEMAQLIYNYFHE
ncbi:MAG: excinuclease ABC subunit UvrC [Gammaproteobacteria bacterium]|nr:excinuclease ABC subunit UvrC [Gammaproteobacteria bacterium]